jgi:membrane protein
VILIKFQDIGQLIHKTITRWIDDDAITDSAAIAFYFLLSMPAILLFSVSLGSIFLKSKSLQDLILVNIDGIVDNSIRNMIITLFNHLPQTNSLSISTMVSLLILLWTASAFFSQLHKFIEKTWKIKHNTASTIYEYARNTILSAVVVIVFGCLLVIGIIADSIVYVISTLFDGLLPFSAKLASYSTAIVSFAVLLVFFVFVYRMLSHRQMSYRYVLMGSLVTVTLITIGKYIVTLYLMYSNPLSVYGAIGSLIGLLFLIFYSAIMMTFSIELVKVYIDFKVASLVVAKLSE